MSQENVETVQRAVAAWNADDLDAFLAELDADVEWQPAIESGLEGKATTYRGHDGARRIWKQDRGEAWERLTNRPQEFRDLGESVLVLGHIDMTARVTGIEFRQEVGEVFDLRAGKIVRIRDFLTHAEAIETVGLSDQTTSQENVETSVSNVELVRLAVDAVNKGDLATLDAIWSDQGEFHSTFAASEGRVFRGRQGVRDYFATLGEVFDDMAVAIEELCEAGEDRLVVVVRVTGRGKGSGVNVEQRNGQVWTVVDSKIARVDSYMSRAEALEAVGLRP